MSFEVLRWPRTCDMCAVMNAFKADIEDIRRRALEKMDDGAVTASYRADRDQVVDVLNEVLATETVCTLRYRSHYFMAKGIHSSGVEDEFLEHARQEQDHADRVAERIAIATYSEIVRWLGNDDPTTRRMMEEILATEEEHADDMAKLLSRVRK